MPIPFQTLKTYEKTRVDLAIDVFVKIEKPTLANLNGVKTQVDIQCKIDAYRLGALKLNKYQLETEMHTPERMAQLMTASYDARPTSAEHVIVMRLYRVRITRPL